MRILSRLSILLIVTASFASFLPPSSSVLCPEVARADGTLNFGEDGQSGNSGRSGNAGRSGADQVVFADGSSVSFELSGGDGEDGEDGRDGRDAYCHRQPRDEDRSLYAASGGRGGRGGNGGEGGNGGNLTVYYSKLSDLKSIFVRAEGGIGGLGGRGGYGGEGCQCDRHNWERKTCKGTPGSPDYKCKTRHYHCTDGQDGQNGSRGQDGQRGALGKLTLIQGRTPLLEEKPTLTAPLARLGDRPISLSKNRWEVRTGAVALLASGSIVEDQYREFAGRIEREFQLVWNETQSIAGFSDPATLTLNESGQVKIDFPEDLWVDGSLTQQNPLTTLTIAHVIHKSDVTRLAVADFAQSDKNLTLTIVDLGGRADVLNTQFQIKYRTKSGDRFSNFSNYETRYQGTLPTEVVSRSYNRYTLALGKLPIDTEYLGRGSEVEIELVATRTLADRSATQKIDWQGKIR
ncbi:MAG: hypothetical protein KME16_14685 [Scytolyngbya sp. HA4215-MV1]|nr:hypothetical protein [Scytolyngbya sp. HA4215-MV1]